MKSLIRSLVLLFVVLFITGCFKVNTKVIVNADGSGIIEELLLLSDATIKIFNEFAGSFDESAKDKNEFKVFKLEELKSKAANYGSGVKFVSAQPHKPEGWDGYKVQYSFADIKKVKMNMNEDKTPIGENQLPAETESKPQFVSFDFSKNRPAELTVIMPVKDFDDKKSETSETSGTAEVSSDTTGNAMLQQMYEMMSEMEMSFKVRVNGTISETNATFVEGNTLTLMYINFGSLLKNVENIKEIESLVKIESLEDAKKLMSKFDGIKIEIQDKVKVKFD